MDLTTITSLITALRQETAEESISPELLGSLLQRIADAISTAALQSDVTTLNKWKTIITSLGTIITDLFIGADDANNIYISSHQSNLTNGFESIAPRYITIPPATTSRAGTMSTQHVNALDSCTTSITTIQSTITTLNSALTTFNTRLNATQNALSSQTTSVNSNTLNITTLKSSVNSLQSQLRTLQANFNTFASIKQTSMVWIECSVKEGCIYIDGANQLINAGLTPVIFRYSNRSSRTFLDVERDTRDYLPERHGWNRFYDNYKLQVDENDLFSFRDEEILITEHRKEYSYKPNVLFSKETVLRDDNNKINKIFIYFGKTAYNVLRHQRRFRFAIAFYKKTTDDPIFHFSSLRTNLAEFYVAVKAKRESGSYKISYQYSR